jgi:hypothetical protein
LLSTIFSRSLASFTLSDTTASHIQERGFVSHLPSHLLTLSILFSRLVASRLSQRKC